MSRGRLQVTNMCGTHPPLTLDLDQHTKLVTFKDLLKFLGQEWKLSETDQIVYVSSTGLDPSTKVSASVVSENRAVGELGARVTVTLDRPTPIIKGKNVLYVNRMSIPCQIVLLLAKTGGLIDDGTVQIVDLDLAAGHQRKEGFLKLNPSGTVPTYRDADGLVIFESDAIMRHLVSKHHDKLGALMPIDAEARAFTNAMLDWRYSTLYPAIAKIVYPQFGIAPPLTAEESTAAAKAIGDIMVTFEKRLLKDQDFLGGDSPSLADVAVGCCLPLLSMNVCEMSPAVTAYFQRFCTAFEHATDVWNGLEGYGLGKAVQQGLRDRQLAQPVLLHLDRIVVAAMGIWILVETSGIPYELHDVSVLKGENKTKKFGEINPMHEVPALTASADSFNLFESHAILRYLCETYNTASKYYPTPTAIRTRVDQALSWKHCSLFPAIKALAMPALGLSAKLDAEQEKAARATLEKHCAVLLSLIGSDDFIAGSAPTIADMAIAPLFIILGATDFVPENGITEYLERFRVAFPYIDTIVAGGDESSLGVVQFIENRQKEAAEAEAKAAAIRAKEDAKVRATEEKKQKKQHQHDKSGDVADEEATTTTPSSTGSTLTKTALGLKEKVAAGLKKRRKGKEAAAAAENEDNKEDNKEEKKKKSKSKRDEANKDDDKKEDKKKKGKKADEKSESADSDNEEEGEEEDSESSGNKKSKKGKKNDKAKADKKKK